MWEDDGRVGLGSGVADEKSESLGGPMMREWCVGYTNLNKSSSVSPLSERRTRSSLVGISEGGNAPVQISRFFRWMWSRTPSADSKITSASEEKT